MTLDPACFVLSADHVIPVRDADLSPGWVAVENGLIASVGDGPPPRDRGPVHELGEAAIIPGFVNAHTHLGCAFLKGVGDDLDFVSWITSEIAPRVMETVRDRPDHVRRWADSAAEELLAGGVTCVVESFFHDAGLHALRGAGLRGLFCREFFGSTSRDPDGYLAEVRARIAADVADLSRPDEIGYGLAPHALYTCPAPVLSALEEEGRRRALPVTIHLDESEAEHRLFTDREGPLFSAMVRGREDRYRLDRTPTRVLEELGLLRPGVLLVHAVHLTEEDLDLVATSGAAVVHCPTSNMKLAVGCAPVAEMKDRGIPVALGTDSPASVGKLDLFEEMRVAILAQRARTGCATSLTARDALTMATWGGARAIGLDTRIGFLGPGADADIAAVALDRPRHRPFTDPVSALVWGAQPDDVLGTWVRGRQLHRRDRRR